jgi:hypothetical protein
MEDKVKFKLMSSTSKRKKYIRYPQIKGRKKQCLSKDIFISIYKKVIQ